jgi:hypothetical protein
MARPARPAPGCSNVFAPPYVTTLTMRNHMRDMLFVFKGAPSTSPFCTWINDPREPEELPQDWAPQEPAAVTLPDDPPF